MSRRKEAATVVNNNQIFIKEKYTFLDNLIFRVAPNTAELNVQSIFSIFGPGKGNTFKNIQNTGR